MQKPIQLTGGGAGQYDPLASYIGFASVDYINPTLKGVKGYVEKSGYGILPNANYAILAGGGFTLLIGSIAQDEVYFYVPYDSALTISSDQAGYTNGFNFSKVIAAMFGRIGWKQPTQAELQIVADPNLTSRSGRYFNDFHTLCNIQNAKSICEDADISDPDFNTWLVDLQKAVILQALTGVFNEPEYISQGLLYERYRFYDVPIENTSKFIPIRIKLPSALDLAVQIDSISLYFDQDVTFNLYLFDDAKRAPVRIISVSAIANTQTIIQIDNLILNYVSDTNHGGVFYLGYFQDDLGSTRAIRENAVNCKANMPYGYAMCECVANGVDFDRQNVGYALYNTYGINAFISVFRDQTYKILNKAFLLDDLVGLQMAVKIIEQSIYNTRSNSTERQLKDAGEKLMAYMEANGTVPISDAPTTTGLKQKITKELARVKNAFIPKPQPVSQSLSYACN